ncbi:hypothetical protein GCG54_00008392 [Colletotrichum gloeosporioides]|uniref:Uncharacterized protein n=1 Tax=Colletotrichum gloeosporioides TaxID=474922 RepID=A0A8H4CH41_COLGL|nr:uncharacterized protein GCG54_00008392 [Colletotrichum gloeosporioides]KAF3803890.1 hypothetical protein GCG54_00008392 [Colletotrichum gloeosporioides]
MTTPNNSTARLKYDQDWPKWFLQLQLRAHEQNVWEYINPKAADSNVPVQRPPLDETIMRGQTEVTESDVRQEYPDRFAEYFTAANESFEIEERHVQLALKLARLKTVNRKYLNKLMAPFSHEFDSDIRETSEYFRASPKIIQERFLLYTQLDIVDRVGLTLNSCDYNEICPHMVIDSSDKTHGRLSGPENFSTDVRMALSQRGNEITGHCPRCPTDYAITASPNGMRIQAWKDFGSYKSPKDDSWTVHVWSEQNSSATGPAVYHDPGSIRKLYVTGTGENTQQ